MIFILTDHYFLLYLTLYISFGTLYPQMCYLLLYINIQKEIITSSVLAFSTCITPTIIGYTIANYLYVTISVSKHIIIEKMPWWVETYMVQYTRLASVSMCYSAA